MPAPLVVARRSSRALLHPLHALLLGFPIALFTTALVNDIAYLKTAEMQWSNFAAWAIVGALVVGAPVVLWAAIQAIRYRTVSRYRTTEVRGRAILYLILIAVMWIAGLINAFQHSRDAWSSVGVFGLLLSIVATVCALAAGWIGYSTVVAEDHAVDESVPEGDAR